MDLNWLLLWLCGISAAINLFVSLQNRHSPARGWRTVLSALLMLIVVAWLLAPDVAGYVVTPVWLLFVLLPGLLLRQVNQLFSRRRHRLAYWLARLAGWLHPFDGWPQHAQLVRAVWLFDEGRTAQASALLNRLGRISSSLGRTARLIQAQQTGGWQDLLEWIDRHHSPEAVLRDEALSIARLQALGELGRPAEMLREMDALLTNPRGLSPHGRAILRMRVAALAGQVKATERQLESLTKTYSPDIREFWILTARQVAGDDSAPGGFRQLQKQAGPYLQSMIARRIQNPLPRFEPSSDAALVGILSTLTDRIEHGQEFSLWADESPTRPWATWGIAAILSANFVREMVDGSGRPSLSLVYAHELINRSLDPNHLIDLGALIIPQSYTPGEWWRILTAGFLHFGPLHLGLNLLGLLALAPRLERAWGRVPMLVCYFTATLTSMALAPHVMSLMGETSLRILVGASGGMMGLLGGLVGFVLVGWLQHRTEETRRPLVFLLVIIGLQTTFDLSTPNVSFAAHILGLATGCAYGFCWTLLAGHSLHADTGLEH